MVKYILDTDTCSYILRHQHLSAMERFKNTNNENIYLSIITYAELLFGATKTQSKKISIMVIDKFAEMFTVLPWDKNAAIKYADLRDHLTKNGNMIDTMDLLIASHAKSHNLTLVTNNIKHFNRIPTLQIENWVND